MLKAYALARRTLPEFLDWVKSDAGESADYSVKVRISSGDDVEYFWVSPFTKEGTTFSGLLANDGVVLSEYQVGQRYEFTEADIYDWLYIDQSSQQMRGNFTACAMLTQESPAEAEKFANEYGLDCSDF